MAGRYMQIADAWTRPSINDSDLENLPADSMKLLHLGRLGLDQFRELAASEDLQELNRGEVIAAVEKIKPSKKSAMVDSTIKSLEAKANTGTDDAVKGPISSDRPQDEHGATREASKPQDKSADTKTASEKYEDAETMVRLLIQAARSIAKHRNDKDKAAAICHHLCEHSKDHRTEVASVLNWAGQCN